MTADPRRWWLARSLGRGPLTRPVDRAQSWAVVIGIVVLLVAAHYAAGLSRTIYASRSQAIAVEAASHHAVEATALSASTSTTKPTVPAVTVTHSDHVQWFAGNATHDEVIEVDHAVEAGERLTIWLDDAGQVTTPPPTDRDAEADAIGGAMLLWLLCLALVSGSYVVLRRMLDRTRGRAWDRELRLLVDDGGGSSTTRTP